MGTLKRGGVDHTDGDARQRGSALLDTLAPVLETALDAVVVLTPDGLVADWNAGAASIFGWSRAEAIGQPLAEMIIPHELRDAHAAGMHHHARTGEGPLLRKLIEVPALHRSGARLPVELLITPVEDGETRFFLGFLRDITQRQAAERALQRQARVSALMFEIAALAGATDSFEEAVAAALRAVCDLSGWPAGHAWVVADDGTSLVPSMIWHPRDASAFAPLKAATRAMRFGVGQGLPGRILQSGEPVWIGKAKTDPFFIRNTLVEDVGVEAAFGFPIKSGEAVIVVMEFFSQEAVQPDAELIQTVGTVGEQIGRVFERKLLEDRLRAEKAALETEVTERARMQAHQALLMAELNHRVKNTLTVVMGIASQTARSSRTMREFNDDFLGRLSSLARTHSLLTERNWGATALGELASDVIAPHVGAPDSRVALEGPVIMLDQKAALSMSMILHELATNAVKHGALAVPDGRLALTWALDVEGRVSVRWCETGVAIAGPPTRTGFGSKMIRACVGHELHGESQAHWHANGLEYVVSFPASGAGAL